MSMLVLLYDESPSDRVVFKSIPKGEIIEFLYHLNIGITDPIPTCFYCFAKDNVVLSVTDGVVQVIHDSNSSCKEILRYCWYYYTEHCKASGKQIEESLKPRGV